jgi:hypothetical protein
VRGWEAGDVMVDGSVRGERLRPLVLSGVAAEEREPVARGSRPEGWETIVAGWRAAITVASLSR